MCQVFAGVLPEEPVCGMGIHHPLWHPVPGALRCAHVPGCGADPDVGYDNESSTYVNVCIKKPLKKSYPPYRRKIEIIYKLSILTHFFCLTITVAQILSIL